MLSSLNSSGGGGQGARPSGAFTRTPALIGFTLRREGKRALIWLACLAAMCVSVGAGYAHIFAKATARAAVLVAFENPATVALAGPAYGRHHDTIGAIFANKMFVWTALSLALMSVFLIMTYTRKDEESGRLEMIGALPVGRLSPVTAAMVVATAVNVVIGVVIGAGLTALGKPGMDADACFLFGAAVAAVGICFAGIAAVAAQLCTTSRTATSYCLALTGALFALRAVGDVQHIEWLSRLSPLGLILRTQVYVENHWWPAAVVAATGLVLFGVALALNAGRDQGAGLIPDRKGRAHASALLSTPLGFALRMQRASLISWFIALVATGACLGAIGNSMGDFLKKSSFAAALVPKVSGYSSIELFLITLLILVVILSTIPALSAIAHVNSEEHAGRSEQILATGVSRVAWLGSHLLIALAMVGLMLLTAAASIWATAAPYLKDLNFTHLLEACAVYLPSMLVMVGLACALIGIAPALAGPVSWAYTGLAFVLLFIGDALRLPDWCKHLTPYGFIRQYPMHPVHWPTMWLLVAGAVFLMAVGLVTYRQRDIAG